MMEKSNNISSYFSLAIYLISVAACTTAPIYEAEILAQQYQWQRQIIETPRLNFMAFSAPAIQTHADRDTLFIYIEGDGQAWKSKHQISDNPTPLNAIGFGLATQHEGHNAVYLARPCQYLSQAYLKNCTQSRWTDGRYSEETIAASHQAILQLKSQYRADALVLVGYSGGGTLAAFVAAREKSVIQLITIAAPIDHTAWTHLQSISPLSTSLSIQSYEKNLANTRQIHFTGSSDTIVPSPLIETWAGGMRESFPHTNIEIIKLENFDHNCCWVENWSELSNEYIKVPKP